MTTVAVKRHRTAINRPGVSRPIRTALQDGLIGQETVVFDYGCGRGTDIKHLEDLGIQSAGWDPVYHAKEQLTPADVVNLGYVINVIEDAAERAAVLREAWSLSRKALVVAARLAVEASRSISFSTYEDGYLTRRGTFQKFYEQHELRTWIDEALGVSSVPAGPGIFYVFRDSDFRQSFLASRYRRQAATPRQRQSNLLFEQHKALFESLMAFVAIRGRLPDESELNTVELCSVVGSLGRAFQIIRRVTNTAEWDRIREDRAQDLLIYLGLSRFDGRPRFSQLPGDLQLDVRAFFSTYRRACEQADSLLFSAGNMDAIDQACRKAPVGKLTPRALYVHTSALSQLPAILRIYEGCARAYIGAVEGANIVKLHRHTPEISYLCYPEFEQDPRPALAGSLLVPLKTFRLEYRDYTSSENPPILHRKETFLPPEHRLRNKFARLTRQEESYGLYEDPQIIGTREGWNQVLTRHNVQLRGHRLIRAMSSALTD